MDVVPPHHTTFEGISSGYFNSGFPWVGLFGVGRFYRVVIPGAGLLIGQAWELQLSFLINHISSHFLKSSNLVLFSP
jgi:hypothetical protein